jgi:uncharacterized protein (TIGR02265 family)
MTSTHARALPLTDEQLDAELAARDANPADFLPVDTETALDVEARIRDTPLDKQTKGMFFEQMAREARNAGVACEPRYVTFRDYPLRNFMRLQADYAPIRYPGVPLREAIRRMGSEAFPTLMNSIPGRLLFVLARGDFRAALRLAPEAYKHNLSHCSVYLRLETPHQVVLEYRDVWNFPECYHVGVIEGVCRTFGAEARIRTRVYSACEVDLLVRW